MLWQTHHEPDQGVDPAGIPHQISAMTWSAAQLHGCMSELLGAKAGGRVVHLASTATTVFFEEL